MVAVRRSAYPKNWEEIRQQVLARAGYRCEGCGVPQGLPHPRTGKSVRLQCAHLNHDVTDNRPANIAAFCAACHARHDAPMHQRVRKWRRERGQGVLFEVLRGRSKR